MRSIVCILSTEHPDRDIGKESYEAAAHSPDGSTQRQVLECLAQSGMVRDQANPATHDAPGGAKDREHVGES